MRLQKYLSEGYKILRNVLDDIPTEWKSKKKLKGAQKNKLNKELTKILKKTYFDNIPLDDLFKVFEKNGIIPIQEDNTSWGGMLIGGVKKTEMVNFALGWKDEVSNLHGKKAYKAIPNAVFTMTYYKMPSGKYEVIGYV